MILVVNSLLNIILLLSGLLLAGCFRNGASLNEIQEIKGEVFGSYYIVKYRGFLKKEKLLGELEIFFKEFNQEFSTYQSDSKISLFNSSPANKPLIVSSRFIELLKLAKRFYEDTNGAFDPTLGPVIKLWGFGGGEKKQTPKESDLIQAQGSVGFRFIKWDENKKTFWKERDGIQLDVNAIAPGFALDLLALKFESLGVKHFMIDISGDILFRGSKGDGAMWIAGIEKPSKEYAKGVFLAFRMENQAISTSGNYRQFFDDKGVRKSHIIDPRTSRPVAHQVASASVIASSGAEADAWSTAMMVLGTEGIKLAQKHNIKVLLLEAKNTHEFNEYFSNSMKSFLSAWGL